jgi:hypothetical protein
MIVSKKKYEELEDILVDNSNMLQSIYAKIADVQVKLNTLLEQKKEIVTDVTETEISPFLTKDGLYSYKQYDVAQKAKQSGQLKTLNVK